MRVLTVIGARPQFIKAAAVSRTLNAIAGITEMVVHTGQHFDDTMAEIFFEELEMDRPAHDLGIHGGSHGDMTGRMVMALDRLIRDESPDVVMVYGDTNSTISGALAAAKLHVPVAHIEAGLRSYNRLMPEEINRVLTDHVSDLLLCPTTQAVKNLAREGITAGVRHVGDVMLDVARWAADRSIGRTVIADLGVEGQDYAVATIHRAENTDDPARFSEVVGYLRSQSMPVVWPVHPRARQALQRDRVDLGHIVTSPPLGYLDMTRLLTGASMVLTDSGGLQKEAYFHRVPCVTLREETEWVETVEHGWNRLWRQPDWKPRRPIADYGDGNAASACAHAVAGMPRRS